MPNLSEYTDCPHASDYRYAEKFGRPQHSVRCNLLSDALGWKHRQAGRCEKCNRRLDVEGSLRKTLLGLLRLRISHLWTWDDDSDKAKWRTKTYEESLIQYRDETSKEQAAASLVEATRRGLSPERAEAAATAAEITQEVEDALSRVAPA